MLFLVLISLAAFDTERRGSYSICPEKIFLAIIFDVKNWQNIQEPRDRQTKTKVLRIFSVSPEQYASKEKCIKWLNNVGTFVQGFKDRKEIKRTAYQNLDDFQNLLTKSSVKDRAEKSWLLYKFSFSLNPYLSLYPVITEDQFQAYSKKKMMEHYG